MWSLMGYKRGDRVYVQKPGVGGGEGRTANTRVITAIAVKRNTDPKACNATLSSDHSIYRGRGRSL